jgi:putative ABC transport system permease protein
MSSGPEPAELRIVGVVENLMHWTVNGPNLGDIYLPFTSLGGGNGVLEIGIRHDDGFAAIAPLVRNAVRELDPDLPITSMTTMEERISESIASPRFYASLLVTFAAVAFLLAAAGVYSSMLYIVGMRRREMGIRLALGANSRDLVRLVLTHGTTLLAVGAALGLIGALTLTRLLRSLLFEVSPTDPITLAAAVGLLGAARSRCLLPACAPCWRCGTDHHTPGRMIQPLLPLLCPARTFRVILQRGVLQCASSGISSSASPWPHRSARRSRLPMAQSNWVPPGESALAAW